MRSQPMTRTRPPEGGTTNWQAPRDGAATQSGNQFPHSSGMTLIELLIVLGIMAALATVALTALDGMGDRTRADTTRSRLDAIEEAIVGDGRSPGRFISDMGRLPVKHDQIPNPANPSVLRDTQAGEGLVELWSPLDDNYARRPVVRFFNGFESDSEPIYITAMTSHGVPPVDTDGVAARFPETGLSSPDPASALIVELPGGWQGPYLQVGGDRLFDGFGNAFHFTQDQPAYPPRRTDLVPPIVWRPITDEDLDERRELTGVASYGRDNREDSTTPDDEDWTHRDEVRLLGGDRSKATLIVSIKVASSAGWQSPVCSNEIEAPQAEYQFGDIRWDGTQAWVCAGVTPTDESGESGEGGGGGEGEGEGEGEGGGGGEGEGDGEGEGGGSPAAHEDFTWRPVSRHEYMNRMRVVLFMPFADPDYTAALPVRTRVVTAWSEKDHADNVSQECADTESGTSAAYCEAPVAAASASQEDRDGRRIVFHWTKAYEVQLDNLPPGIRKLYVYGYYETSGNVINNAQSSGLQTMELKPGVNHITVYLTAPLGL